jgi:hypothetical protein
VSALPGITTLRRYDEHDVAQLLAVKRAGPSSRRTRSLGHSATGSHASTQRASSVSDR